MEPSAGRDTCPKCGARYPRWLWILPARGQGRQRVTCRQCGEVAIVGRGAAAISTFLTLVLALIGGIAGYALDLSRQRYYPAIVFAFTIAAVTIAGYLARLALTVEKVERTDGAI